MCPLLLPPFILMGQGGTDQLAVTLESLLDAVFRIRALER